MPAILKDLSSGQSYALEDFTLIGRGEGASLQLGDAGVSRQHASIRREEHNYWLLDLGSANGSFVNGVELTGARVLRHGDRLQLGDSTLVFLAESATGGAAAADDERTRISLA